MSTRVRLAGAVSALAVLFPAAPVFTQQAPPPSAVVTIIVKTPTGTSFGSGVFVSQDGVVLTCYHVVQDALSIEMLNSGTLVPDDGIVVEKIDPVHDLASLRVTKLGRPNTFFSLGTDIPTPDDALWVIGYIKGLQNQTVSVKTTQSGYAKAGSFLDNQTSPFAQRDVDLIPLDALIYRGMSGAPLIFRNRTVGIVSGSMAEGGTLAWAIPPAYINSASAVSIRQPASAVKWPPLRLMATGWTNLRRQLSPDSPYAEDVAVLVAFSQSAFLQLRPMYESWRPYMATTFARVRQALARVPGREDDTDLDDLVKEGNVAATEARMALKSLATRMEDFYDAGKDLEDDIGKWLESLKDLERELDISADNASTRQALRRVRAINRELQALESSQDRTCEPAFDALESLIEEDEVSATVAEIRDSTQDRCLAELDRTYQIGFRAVESMSAVGQALENLLEEPALRELEKARR